jgi:hypothetical protein
MTDPVGVPLNGEGKDQQSSCRLASTANNTFTVFHGLAVRPIAHRLGRYRGPGATHVTPNVRDRTPKEIGTLTPLVCPGPCHFIAALNANSEAT